MEIADRIYQSAGLFVESLIEVDALPSESEAFDVSMNDIPGILDALTAINAED